MRTNVYIDGYNLYYGCLKGTKLRWLDLRMFAEALAGKGNELGRIRYFTARVNGHGSAGQGTQTRQNVYLRAVATLNVDVEFGSYQSKPAKAYLFPVGSPPQVVTILKNEEKGSDVNIASYLLLDGMQGDYERAIVVSNDSDLTTPVRLVRDVLKKPIGVAFPCTNPGRHRSVQLQDACTFQANIWKSSLKQLPEELTDANGTFSRPARWK